MHLLSRFQQDASVGKQRYESWITQVLRAVQVLKRACDLSMGIRRKISSDLLFHNPLTSGLATVTRGLLWRLGDLGDDFGLHWMRHMAYSHMKKDP